MTALELEIVESNTIKLLVEWIEIIKEMFLLIKPATKQNPKCMPEQSESVANASTANIVPTKHVLLQTTRAFVHGKDGSKVIEARKLFEGGSQHSCYPSFTREIRC